MKIQKKIQKKIQMKIQLKIQMKTKKLAIKFLMNQKLFSTKKKI